MVLETYFEFSNGIGTIWKLCACSFRFYNRFDLLWSLNYLFFTNCVWLYSEKVKCPNIWRTLLSKVSWCWYLSSKIWYRIIENYQNTKNRYFSMCLVDVLTKYGDDRSSFEILSPDNGIPLKNLGLTPLTVVSVSGQRKNQGYWEWIAPAACSVTDGAHNRWGFSLGMWYK